MKALAIILSIFISIGILIMLYLEFFVEVIPDSPINDDALYSAATVGTTASFSQTEQTEQTEQTVDTQREADDGITEMSEQLQTTTETFTTVGYTKPAEVMINETLTGIYIENMYFWDKPEPIIYPESYMLEGVPMVYQKDLGLLTGCEIVAAVMLLNYYLETEISAEEAMQYLEMGTAPYWTSEGTFGGDPEYCFVGNPFLNSGYGCYSPALERMMVYVMLHHSSYLTVKNITNCQVDELFYQVSQGRPVVVWATGKLMTPTENIVYTALETGEQVTWLAGEHCMVLVGYDEENVYLNCPLYGEVSYSKDKFILRWEQMGRQAIVIEE